MPIVGLALLAPFCAEYLVGYQGVITNPAGLLFGVVFMVPIYGAPAVLIRESTRRMRRGWPTMMFLATAAGLIQAGLIDQSLFNHAQYSDGPLRVRIPFVDIDATQLVTFIVGHIVWSFSAPIALVESLVPARSNQPWLRWPGLIGWAMVYVGGAVFFWQQLVVKAGFHARPSQLILVAAAAVVVIAAAFVLPGRATIVPGRVPPAWLVGIATLALLLTDQLVLESWRWLGVALALLALAVLTTGLALSSSRTGWSQAHILAAAAAALLTYALMAFAVNPDNTPTVQLITARGVVLIGIVALLTWARQRIRQPRTEPVVQD